VLILNTPNTDYNNFSERARFVFTWRLSLFLAISLSVVTTSYVFIQRPNTIPFFIGFVTAVCSIIVLIKTRKYKSAAILNALFGVIALNAVLFLITDGLHLGSLLWMVVISLFTYFTLGKKWGNIIVIINAIGYSRYIIFQLDSNISNLPPYTTQIALTLALEITICLTIIAYLAKQFIKTNAHAEAQQIQANDELNEQNIIISMQNKEKELMLKEIHHRVKNNLQVITSLLRLQSNELEESKSKEFAEAIDRVKAMALIHEKMYQTDEFSGLKLENYFESLANELIATYSLAIPVQLNIDSEFEQVGSKTIVPLALLFNELISNSIKHAFTNSDIAIITVNLIEKENAFFQLTYHDNGTWKEQKNKYSFGVELISTMTEQLDGEYELVKSNSGSEYKFLLKNLEEDFQK